MPKYWSGTNCRASGSAQIGEPIYAAELWLNSERVYRWDAPDPDVLPMSMSLKVMFDSSHFAYGTTVEVTFRVWGLITGMREVRSTPDPMVANKLMMFEHKDAGFTPDAVPEVQSLMSGSLYYQIPINGGTWADSTYFAALNGSNAVFYAGHGNDFEHLASDEDPGTTMSWLDYQLKRTDQIGTGIPPFNSGAPPVNFCHIVACNCGDTSNFIKVCYPYHMAWGGPVMEDQALMAYKVFIRMGDVSIHANTIWNKLAQGWTAAYTKAWFDSIWLDENPGTLRVWDVYPGTIRDMAPGDLALYYEYGGSGDGGAMRLKTVYTGSNVLPIGWYRPL